MNFTPTFRKPVGAPLLGLLLGLGALSLASPAQAADQVQLKISVIHATPAAGKPDPALRPIQRSLEKTFGKRYKGFKQLDKASFTLKKGGTRSLKLPNGKAAKFTYKGPRGREHLLQFAVPMDKLDISLRASLNKMFYQAGMRYGAGRDKGILILALSLREP